ncbi:MAG: PIG-L family deacetylase [Coriobacteriia bacterium]|nr:PIG-L family deacetylase [Coriobacteriia bacterium]
MADVVCIGAHPDDVEIGMGATIAEMAASGLDVVIVDLTDGEPTPYGTA